MGTCQLILKVGVIKKHGKSSLAKWILEFLGIPRNKGVNFHGKFGLGIPNHNNSGSKNLEIPRNSPLGL